MHALGLEETSLVWKCVGDLGQALEDALHVDDHRLDRAGEHRELLVEHVARGRHALAHERLVGGAADAGDVDALGADRLGELDHLGLARRVDDHRGEQRLVAVDEDVDLVLGEHAEVRLAADRLRRAVEDVLQVGREHRAAPAAGERALDRAVEQRLVVLVGAGVRAVHRLDDLAVDAARHHVVACATAPGASAGARAM